jgi:hypothetical protein
MWVDRALQITHISRSSRSLSVDPVSQVDATFSTQDGYEAADNMAGFNAFTRQILATGVLDSLIQMQSDMSAMDDDNVTVSANVATDAYRHALDGLSAL